jgi:hypothetical protein
VSLERKISLVSVISARNVILCNVCNVNYRLQGEKTRFFNPFKLIRIKLYRACALSCFKRRLYLLENGKLLEKLLIRLCRLGGSLDSALYDLKVGENKLEVDGLYVTKGINVSITDSPTMKNSVRSVGRLNSRTLRKSLLNIKHPFCRPCGT